MAILKVRTSRHTFPIHDCVCIERRAVLKFSETLDPNEPGIKKNVILLNKNFLGRSSGCVPLSKIQPSLFGLLYQHHNDIPLISRP